MRRAGRWRIAASGGSEVRTILTVMWATRMVRLDALGVEQERGRHFGAEVEAGLGLLVQPVR